MKDRLEDYVQKHSTPPDALLHDIYRQTNLRTIYPRMISGPIQGKLLEMICHMLQPKRVLEIGTFTAYATISMASAMPMEGLLTTIEADEELEPLIRSFIARAGLQQKIELLIGDAKLLIPNLKDEFDLVFIDADKLGYPTYYQLVFEKVRTGGFILADNVLWSGKVADPAVTDAETKAIREFNQLVANDSRVEQVILPLRDGLTMIRKLS